MSFDLCIRREGEGRNLFVIRGREKKKDIRGECGVKSHGVAIVRRVNLKECVFRGGLL